MSRTRDIYFHRKSLIFLIVLIMISLNSCGDDTNRDPFCPSCPWCPKRGSPKPPNIEAVPETLYINDHTYIIKCELWRDFMPISPPGGKYMNAHVRIIETDSIEIPDDLDAVYLWALKDGEIWGSSFSDEELRPTPPYELANIARCGPKWDTDIYVDVVVKLLIGGGSYFLKEEDVYILRTE